MVRKRFRPNRRPPSFKPQRRDIRRWLLLVPLLLIAGALLDPSLIPPVGPLAARPEQVAATFTACGPGRGAACVVDGDTFKLGDRKIRITGIDAPELAAPKCAAEAALAKRGAAPRRAPRHHRAVGMVAPPQQQQEPPPPPRMVIRRDGQSIGALLIDEGLAHRYIGSKTSWC